MTSGASPGPDDHTTVRRGQLLQAVRAGTEASRNNANKWDPLYKWFQQELGVGTGTNGGAVIAKLITEPKQIGNRIDEMAKSNPKYAVISLSDGVEADKVLQLMRTRASLPSLKCILFLDDLKPSRFVIFDE